MAEDFPTNFSDEVSPDDTELAAKDGLKRGGEPLARVPRQREAYPSDFEATVLGFLGGKDKTRRDHPDGTRYILEKQDAAAPKPEDKEELQKLKPLDRYHELIGKVRVYTTKHASNETGTRSTSIVRQWNLEDDGKVYLVDRVRLTGRVPPLPAEALPAREGRSGFASRDPRTLSVPETLAQTIDCHVASPSEIAEIITRLDESQPAEPTIAS